VGCYIVNTNVIIVHKKPIQLVIGYYVSFDTLQRCTDVQQPSNT